MPVDVKKWLAEKAAEIGLDQNELSVAEKLMGSAKFKGDFVGLPDFHSALDRQKRQYESKLDEVLDMNEKWQEKYDTEYAPALTALQKLQQSGFDTRGMRNTAGGGAVDTKGNALTAEQVEAMIAQRLEPVRAGSIDWGTFVADKAVEHHAAYGKPFEASKFRKFAYENRDQYPTYESAYQAYTTDDRKAKEEKEKEDWKAAERERIRLELMSSQNLPEAVGDNGSPMFIANDPGTKEVSRDEARAAFAKQFATADFSKITS